jgi:tetratricopeptide (TPR) repeat protein
MKMKMKKYIEISLLITVLTFGLNISKALADSKEELAAIYVAFGKGEYDEALGKAEKLKGNADNDVKAMAFYWIGLIYSNKQEYDQAIPNFQNALQFKVTAKDIHYQLGQALYASQDMEKAKVQFLKSQELNFKPETSLYYSGYISQILENYKDAINYYKKIIANKADAEKIKKSALFQMAEVRYYLLKEKKLKEVPEKEKLINEILPLYKKAKEYDENDPLTFTVTAKIADIQKAHKIDLTPRMNNGRIIQKDSFTARIGLDLTYDTNIILRADETTASPANKDSFLYKVSPFAKYQWEIDKTYFVTPEIGYSYKYHARRHSPNVYKNDNYSIDPAIRNSYEHTLFGDKASVMFEIEYNYTAQDYGATKDLRYYSQHYQFILGEKFNLFKFGETTFQAKGKDKNSYTISSKSQTLTINLSQSINMPNGYALTVALNADFERFKTTPTSDANTYKLTLSPVIPERFFTYYTIAPAFNVTVADPRNTRPTKGLEQTYNPSLKLKRNWNGLDMDINYGYTNKYSKDKTTSAYSKHEIGLATTYNFR